MPCLAQKKPPTHRDLPCAARLRLRRSVIYFDVRGLALLPRAPAPRPEEKSTAFCRNELTPHFVSDPVPQLPHCADITGKAFEAAALADNGADGGGTVNFALLGFRWQVMAGVAAIIASMWELKTQRHHGDAHSAKCVCTVCHSEYYGDD